LSLLHPDQLHGRIVPPEPFPIPRPL
jgi:hypothetical protein